ncbi:SusC/RagA family TonB-linked outer membrane protein [Williamwhitmania taraxaci]|uniref:TonB-linked outer membrane protein, SusC/RagA family n=1 Tax=Williamwhitmania taraxaci TaxID=1640674 RepID=A0A1G6S672_9BACT|nr:TonB-dependent receptor [Williamwhitmania taraxaci]SDD12378.1 TonB-linked outer membrane protein, SusC/RagA family [Williamwhitmania taraxaci]
MKKLIALVAILGLIGLQGAFAQTRSIKGTVTSKEDGMGLPGVNVTVKGTTIGTATDIDGNFTISVSADAKTLVFSSISYQSVEMPIQDVVNVVLEADTKQIDEVIVTGYGVTRKSAFTGAATTVGKKEMEGKFSPDPVRALEGNVTGLQMTTGSGQPGSPATIFIRGRNSLNSGTQPLYIVDGVPFTSDVQGMRENEGQTFSPLSTISPSDIENITVLKDATATSIYGARAANGVIVITTKKGKQGSFNVSFTARLGFEKLPEAKNYKLLNASKFTELSVEAALNNYALKGAAGTVDYYNTAYGLNFPYDAAGMKDFLYWYTPGVEGVDTDWLKEVTRTGMINQYTIDIQSGGKEKTSMKYYLSVDYLTNTAIIKGKDLSRYNVRFNFDQAPSDYIKFGLNSNFSHTETNMGAGGGYFSDPMTQAYMQAPINGPKNEDGTWNFSTVNGYNPVAQRSGLGDKSLAKQNRALFSPYVQVNITPDLFFISREGMDAYFMDEFGYWSFLQPQGKDMRGMGEKGNTSNILLTSTNTMNYLKTFGGVHNVNIMVGQEAQKNTIDYAYLSGSNYAVDYLNQVSLTSIPGSAKSTKDEIILQSYFGNAQYDYNNKYYLSGSFRVDGSSRFVKDNYWGKFWSVGAKYRISSESFMESTKGWLNTLMVRSSYGTTGNQTVGGSWYAARNLYDFGYNYNQKPGSAHLQFGNDDLKWEYTAKFNVGMDITIFDRVSITADYYDHKTKDMVFEVPVSESTGLDAYYKNIGELSNKGYELSINVNLLKTNDFNWDVTLNGSHNENRIEKLSTDAPISSTYTIIEEGKDIYTFKMKEWAGVDPATGRGMWYKGESGEETTFNYNEAGKRYLGSASPKFQGSFSTNFSYKGIDFALQLTTSVGGKIYGNNLRYDEHTGGSFGNNFTEYVYDNRWQKPGDNAKVPQLVAIDGFNESAHSSRYLMSGDYVKIRSISLGYNLPKEILQKMFVKSLRVFATADNVYTFAASDYRGFDPSGIGANGVQWWNYPTPRTYTFGLTLGF